MMERMNSMDSIGHDPLADSPDNITASAPSTTAAAAKGKGKGGVALPVSFAEK